MKPTAAPQQAFSLVEVTLAIGIIAVALVGVFALIPVGLRSGSEAVDATRTAFIAQDAADRLRAAVSTATFAGATDLKIRSFYDRSGAFIQGPTGASYYADAIVHQDWGSSGPPTGVDASVLRPATVEVRWPVDASTGAALGNNRANSAFSVRRP